MSIQVIGPLFNRAVVCLCIIALLEPAFGMTLVKCMSLLLDCSASSLLGGSHLVLCPSPHVSSKQKDWPRAGV